MHRPLIQIELSNHDKSIPTSALVDSGTDTTMVDAEIASELGINLRLCTEIPVSGIGKTKGRKCDVNLTLSQNGVALYIKDMSVVFVENLPFGVLLGQKDFFNAVDIRFEKRNNRFFLKKI